MEELLPLESEKWLPPVSRLLGVFCAFVPCQMREENTTKIYLEQHKKNCPHDPCEDGNVSVWNVLQTTKIMHRWTAPVVLCAASACCSKCWPPYSVKIRISAVLMFGDEWHAHDRIPGVGSTRVASSLLQRSPLPVLELSDAVVAQATLIRVWTVQALPKGKSSFLGTSSKREITPWWWLIIHLFNVDNSSSWRWDLQLAWFRTHCLWRAFTLTVELIRET